MDTHGHMKTFKDIRCSRFMSQLEFSQLLLMDQSHYGKLERGMVQPRMSTVSQIAKILKLSPETVQEMILESMVLYETTLPASQESDAPS